MRTILFVALALAAGAARAGDANKPVPPRDPGPPRLVAPTTPRDSTVAVGTDLEKSGPGANATIARSGTGAATVTTDSAVGGNAGHPSRAVPQEGGGGGSGGS